MPHETQNVVDDGSSQSKNNLFEDLCPKERIFKQTTSCEYDTLECSAKLSPLMQNLYMNESTEDSDVVKSTKHSNHDVDIEQKNIIRNKSVMPSDECEINHTSIITGTMPQMVQIDDEIGDIFEKSDVNKAPIQTGTCVEEMNTNWQKLLKQLYRRIVTLEQQNRELTIAVKNQRTTIINLQNLMHFNFGEVPTRNCHGIFIWRLQSFGQKLADMISDTTKMLYSPAFYTNPNGYKICARVNLSLRSTKYLSIVLHIMRSENDDALYWPFNGLIYFNLIHPTIPDKSVMEKALSSPDLEAFQKPIFTLNRRSFGYTEFISLSEVQEFLENDQLIFRIEVKT